MRNAIISIVLAAACSSSAEPPIDETESDPACVEEDVAARSEELAWDLDRDPVSDVQVCPADNPGCDALDELDAYEEDEPTWQSDLEPYGLTDPLTSAGKYRAWPNGRIPYVLATTNGVVQINAAARTALSQAMTNWEQLTEGRIKFRKRVSTDKAYVIVKQGSPRVSPFVGYRKDQVQTLYLRDSEYLTVTKHELGHVIGLHHEQRRTDRGSYIKVRNQYIVDSDTCRYQFATCSTCKPLGTYDRNSVMHYRTHDLPGCRTGSVLLKLDGSAISHVWKVSPKDLTSVAKMYAPPPAAPPPPPPSTAAMPESGSITSGTLCTAVAADNLLELAACNGMGNQDWRLTASGQLRVQDSLQCAGVIGCSVPGAAIEQATCSPTAPDQKWSFEAMTLLHGATGTCVGATLAADDCTKAAQFTVRPDTETIELDGQCLTAGTTITLAVCDGSTAQQWMQARGGFVSRVNTARCMRIDAAGKLGLADCTDGADQRWALRGEIRDGRSDLCLALAGATLALAACDGTQAFTLWSR
jgi:hypothetical protein